MCGKRKPLAHYLRMNPNNRTRTYTGRICRRCRSDQERRRHQRKLELDPLYRRRQALAKYGLTLADYDRMVAQQKGKCYICKTTEFGGRGKKLMVDHCHKTGANRNLLCHHCNAGLGHFKDKVQVLKAAIKYLEDHEP